MGNQQILSWKAARLGLLLLLLVTPGTFNKVLPSMKTGGEASRSGWGVRVDARLVQQAALDPEQPVEMIIFMAEQADLSKANELHTKEEKGAYVFQELTALSRRSQAPLLAELAKMGVEHRSYWAANLIWVRATESVIEKLAQRPDIGRFYANPQVFFDEPDREYAPLSPQAAYGVEWNIAKVKAPEVWAQGFTGQGVVIGGQDTGYDWDHPALIGKYRGWDGSTANHDYNWHDAIHPSDSNTLPKNLCGYDSPEPCDDQGHGTHTMGIMVGDDGGANQIGMAPEAEWIGCRNMEDGWGTPLTYTECFEWFLAPYPVGSASDQGDPGKAPHIINNSWGCPPSEGCTQPDVLQQVVENVRAAGILVVASAGNSGSKCASVNNPAAIYDAAFTVGNTTISDIINPSSSRGPVTVDGSGRLKPDISAPGTSIRSSVPGGYALLSGTSMAAPHVAGLAALLISAKPELAGKVDQLENIIRFSAVPLTTTENCGSVPGANIPNNTYGYGRIDALESLQWLNIQTIYIPLIVKLP